MYVTMHACRDVCTYGMYLCMHVCMYVCHWMYACVCVCVCNPVICLSVIDCTSIHPNSNQIVCCGWRRDLAILQSQFIGKFGRGEGDALCDHVQSHMHIYITLLYTLFMLIVSPYPFFILPFPSSTPFPLSFLFLSLPCPSPPLLYSAGCVSTKLFNLYCFQRYPQSNPHWGTMPINMCCKCKTKLMYLYA